MAFKMTHAKEHSESILINEKKKRIEMEEKAEGKEKIEFEIGTLKSRIFNVRYDLEKNPGHPIMINKLKLMEQYLKEKEEMIKNVDK